MKAKMFIAAALIMMSAMYVTARHTSRITPPLKSAKGVKVKVIYSLAVLQKNVQYDFAKISIRKAYYARLDELAEVISEKKMCSSVTRLRRFNRNL